MSNLRRKVTQLAAGVEHTLDELLWKMRKKWQHHDPLHIVTYRSYGTANRLYIKGRVLEDKGIATATDQDHLFTNLLRMYQRFESDEVPEALLKAHFQGADHWVRTDEEGYFVLNLATEESLPLENLWHQVEVELVEAPLSFSPGVKSRADVLVPPPDAEYGIISDIDDTIIKTNATSLWKMSKNTFLQNARTRLPFAGVSEFYKALQLGRNGKRNNPFFYVSSSPWNLYDLLVDFLDLNHIPSGPLLLRDYGLNRDRNAPEGHMGHKMKEIRQILEAYPHLPFVLIGDSGQEDASIYREVVRNYPGRILAVYIRDVEVPERKQMALTISKELEVDKVEMLVVATTVEAAEHAAQTQLIYTETLPEIEEDKKLDKGEVKGKEDTLDVE